jgi:hypothetical protein
MFRCASCAPGYYPAGSGCVKCPDSPAALFIGFGLIILAAAAIGWFLNRKNVNIAFLSIGVDYFQILAVFANAKVQWPDTLKQLWQILSAFNLNIEVVAPECLVPNLAFQNKWAFIVVFPVALGVFLAALWGLMVVWKKYIRGQRKWTLVLSHTDTEVASALVLFYFLYLYETKTILDIFDCEPTVPPDGKTYLQVRSYCFTYIPHVLCLALTGVGCRCPLW